MDRLVEGNLEEGKRTWLEQHLQNCPRCRAEWQAIQEAERYLREAIWPEPPERLVEQVLEQLPPLRSTVVAPEPLWVRAAAVVAVTAGIALLAVLGLVVWAGLGPATPGHLGEGMRNALAAGWSGVSLFWRGAGRLVEALWQVLGWPWLVGGVVLVGVAAWLWWLLWRNAVRQTLAKQPLSQRHENPPKRNR